MRLNVLHAAMRLGVQCGASCLLRATSASVGSPVRLEGDAVITRHLAEVPLQLSEKLLVAFSLIQRHEGVNVGKLPPGDGLREKRMAVEGGLFSYASIQEVSSAWDEYLMIYMRGWKHLWPKGQNWPV